MPHPKFCQVCATPLEWIEQIEDGGPKARLRCPACGHTHWNNPTPVLAAIVEYLPKIYDASRVDEEISVSQDNAEEMCRRLAREEGIFGGISAAGALWVALDVAKRVENATIVFIVCDRGDRYLSTGVFPA